MSKKEIAGIIGELAPILPGGRVQKIYQPSAREIIVVIRSSRTYMLYFSLDPEFFRLHLISEKLKSPLNPFSFCQFLRKHLIGTSVSFIAQAVDDRVVSTLFTGRGTEFCLVAELFGRNGNLFITDGRGKILQSLIKGSNDEREELLYSLQKLDEIETPHTTLKLNIQAEESYRERERSGKYEALKRRVITDLKKRAGKLETRQEKMRGDLASLEKWKAYLRFGQMIKDNFHLVKKGSDQVQLLDYESEEMCSVPLSPALTPIENMNNYFNRYKKSTRGHKKVRELLAEVEMKVLAIREEMETVRHLTPENLIVKYHRPAEAPVKAGRSKAGKGQTSKPHHFTSHEGLSILVGRSDRQNDEVTFKVAKGNDLWFHVRDSGGAHVVLQAGKKVEPLQESILDAASLALFYSKLKSEGRGEVLYTHRKFLKKPKGDKPGRVTYTRDKTIFIHMEERRIKRLMDSRVVPGP